MSKQPPTKTGTASVSQPPKYDYSGEITYYKLFCKDSSVTDTYIGATKDLKARLVTHSCLARKVAAGEKKGSRLYNYIAENGGWDCWDVLVIETREMPTSQLRAEHENRLRLEHGATLNTQVPGRTIAESNMISRKKWRKVHAKSLKRKRESEEFKKRNRENTKAYYGKHSERLNARNRERLLCPCGCETSRGSSSTHMKSKKHIRRMAAIATITSWLAEVVAAPRACTP